MIAPRRQGGMALVEAVVAVVLLGIGLLGAVGMQARSQSALADTGMRAQATLAAESLLGTMAVDVAHANDYALAANATPSARLLPWYNATRTQIPGAQIVIVVTPAANRTAVDVKISWSRKTGAAQSAHRVVAYLAAAA